MFVRAFLGLVAVAVLPVRAEVGADFAALEGKHGGRLGVAAIDTGSGRKIGHRADERFALCSTFKLLLGAAVLARVDAGELSLDRRVPYGRGDLLSYAPVTSKHVGEGGMTVGDLCAAAIQTSDNTAANLLLPLVGGPAGLTKFLRAQGDTVTRLDRIEPELNTNLPGDPRDTTTPAAMAATMERLLAGKALSAGSRAQLNRWLEGTTTGDARLRAGFPRAWRVGDKTGTGARGAANDVAIVWPGEGAKPWLVAVFYSAPDAQPKEREAVIAEAARLVAAAFYAKN
jgi:beta-lactamase class A